MDAVRSLGQNINIPFGDLTFSPSLVQAGLIIFLLFLLVLTMAQFRRHLLGWSLKGGLFGLFFGFLLALIFEGFLIIGGKTAVTEILGWENAPKPILVALEAGRSKLVSVLGVSDEIPLSNAQVTSSKDEVITKFQSLPPDQAESVRRTLCTP
jgi:hypothetical protein